MALSDLMNVTNEIPLNLQKALGIEESLKIGMSEERFNDIKPILRQYISYWRDYPDMFIDFLQTGRNGEIPKDGLRFFFYQRIFLRVSLRYKYTYFVFPRAYSKSFLTTLGLMIKCILYPGAKLFVSSGGKEQSAGIIQEKVDELCKMVPALKRELDLRQGQTKEGKDYAIYRFKNGSYFDNVAASERSRGKRRHGGVLEECVGVDGAILSEVLIPMMNVARPAADGVKYDEPLSGSQVYITTAGYKNTFPYSKLIQLLVWSVTEPDQAYVMGGTWRIPVLMGLQDKNQILKNKRDETYGQESFNREFESQWTGQVEGAYYNGDIFDRSRILQKPEHESSGKISNRGYYILSCDIGRSQCATVVCVLKVQPQDVGAPIISLVNIHVIEGMNVFDQAVVFKRLFYKYQARKIVIDGNGVGQGVVDAMVKSQDDPETGVNYPDFGVENDENGVYKKFETKRTERDAMYVMKANAAINTECHATVQIYLTSGKLKFLIDERTAQQKLLNTVMGKNMTPEQRKLYLLPFTLTTNLKIEMMNLRQENEGVNIILKQANKGIPKDKFSAFEYGVYYAKISESKKKKKKFNAADWCFMN